MLCPVLLSKYREYADDFIENDIGYISKTKSIGVSIPYDEIISVTFGKEGYYEYVFDKASGKMNEKQFSELSEKLREEMKKCKC